MQYSSIILDELGTEFYKMMDIEWLQPNYERKKRVEIEYNKQELYYMRICNKNEYVQRKMAIQGEMGSDM